MSIRYPPAPGTLVLCNYDTGFRPPEMIKRRPALIVSPRLPSRDGLCAVVPLSTTAPNKVMAYHCCIELETALPPPWTATTVWAKGDMIATVGLNRLDLFRTGRDQYGNRKYLQPKLTPEQFLGVRAAILHGLGLGALTKALTGLHIKDGCVQLRLLRLKTAMSGRPRWRTKPGGAFFFHRLRSASTASSITTAPAP